jgi:hypothetical protein
MPVKTEEVFGVSSRQVLSYIERPTVDYRFVEALKSDKQIVVYGASKQGKTALVSKYLRYEDNIPVSVTPKTEVADIYASILRQLGIKIKSTATESQGTQSGATVAGRLKAYIPFIGGGGEVETGLSRTSQESGTIGLEEVPFNLALPQDISELIKKTGVSKAIIIENFHYLDEERQKQFAFDLRTFQELGIRFVILGVWREKNRLSQVNGDLLDRVVEIPVEPWTEEEFTMIAKKGAAQLDIELSGNVVQMCSRASFSSVGVFQELLKATCILAGVEGKGQHRIINDTALVEKSIATKAQEYASRHQRALEAIGSGYVSATVKQGLQPLFLPYYLVIVILTSGYDGLANGMRRAVIQDNIQKIHHRPKDVRASDMSNLLYNLADLQNKKSISPPIIDFDKTNKMLQVVDSTFYFFLKHANLKEIADEIPNPLE